VDHIKITRGIEESDGASGEVDDVKEKESDVLTAVDSTSTGRVPGEGTEKGDDGAVVK
jgi:hypothetical protein